MPQSPLSPPLAQARPPFLPMGSACTHFSERICKSCQGFRFLFAIGARAQFCCEAVSAGSGRKVISMTYDFGVEELIHRSSSSHRPPNAGSRIVLRCVQAVALWEKERARASRRTLPGSRGVATARRDGPDAHKCACSIPGRGWPRLRGRVRGPDFSGQGRLRVANRSISSKSLVHGSRDLVSKRAGLDEPKGQRRRSARSSIRAKDAGGPNRPPRAGRSIRWRRHESGALLGDRPRRRDLLIEHLHLIQDALQAGFSAAHLAALADEMKLSFAEVFETATFYAHFDVVKEGRRRRFRR